DRGARNALVQALAVHEFEDEELGVVGLNEVVDLSDVRVIERGDDLRLPSEAGDTVRIVGEGGGQNLQSDIASQFAVVREVDGAHAPAPDRRDDVVDAKAGARRQGHV